MSKTIFPSLISSIFIPKDTPYFLFFFSGKRFLHLILKFLYLAFLFHHFSLTLLLMKNHKILVAEFSQIFHFYNPNLFLQTEIYTYPAKIQWFSSHNQTTKIVSQLSLYHFLKLEFFCCRFLHPISFFNLPSPAWIISFWWVT